MDYTVDYKFQKEANFIFSGELGKITFAVIAKILIIVLCSSCLQEIIAQDTMIGNEIHFLRSEIPDSLEDLYYPINKDSFVTNVMGFQPEIKIFKACRMEKRSRKIENIYNAVMTESTLYFLLQTPESINSFQRSVMELINLKNSNNLKRVLIQRQYYNSIFKMEIAGLSSYNSNITLFEKKIKVIDEIIDKKIRNSYMHYSHKDQPKQVLKSIHIYHDNDVLSIKGPNLDRDYTGGVRVELTTDYLKMRVLKRLWNSDDVLSFQSVLISGEGYTPYIRFDETQYRDYGFLSKTPTDTSFLHPVDLIELKDTLKQQQEISDRPFASFQYLARGKYRIHKSGIWRGRSYFKVGIVGGKVGENLQAVLHRDLATKSQRVLNWENQIANGGRLAYNIDHHFDFMLFSRSSSLGKLEGYEDLPKWLNFYLPTEAAFGTVNTHWGAGIGFSNKNFLQQNGLNDFTRRKVWDHNLRKEIWTSPFLFAWELKFRHVIHNSMLSGLGICKAFKEDLLDDEAVTVYALDDSDVKSLIFSTNLRLGISINKVNIYYIQDIILGHEYNVTSVSRSPNPLFNSQKNFGYGRIGLNFKI